MGIKPEGKAPKVINPDSPDTGLDKIDNLLYWPEWFKLHVSASVQMSCITWLSANFPSHTNWLHVIS